MINLTELEKIVLEDITHDQFYENDLDSVIWADVFVDDVPIGIFDDGKFSVHAVQIVFENLLGTADKVLCDVPCSGLGIIRRKPDIKYKEDITDFKELTQIQKNIDIRKSKKHKKEKKDGRHNL